MEDLDGIRQQNVLLQGQVGQLQQQVQLLQQARADAAGQLDAGHVFQAHLAADRDDRQVAREAKRLDLCDGEDTAQVKRYLRELDLVDQDKRLAVLRQTARGAFRREFQRYHDNHAAAPWANIKAHLLSSFVSRDNGEALKQELSKIRQEPFESLLSYNRRFRELADEAYPPPADGGRNQDQERALIKAYGKGLAMDVTARKLTSQGWPATLEAAMNRTAQLETAQTVYDHLGRATEPMEVGSAPSLRPQVPPTSAPAQPQPPLELRRLQTHISKLEAQIQRLTNPRSGPAQKDTRTCYNCRRAGHIARECRAPRQGESRPASFPHRKN